MRLCAPYLQLPFDHMYRQLPFAVYLLFIVNIIYYHLLFLPRVILW